MSIADDKMRDSSDGLPDSARLMARIRREQRAREAAEALIESKARELYAARLDAEMANRAKTEFLSNMGHELRTPLNAILGFAEILQTGLAGELNDQQTEYAANITASAQRLIEVFNQVLDIANMDLAAPEICRQPVAVAEVVRDTFSALRERSLAKQLHITSEVAEGLQVLGDRPALRQVFGNLVGNAIKFTPEGGHVTVTAKADEGDAMVDIAVRDTGIGIPDNQRIRVFAPFYQVSQGLNREHEGAGLGLTIASRLVEMQNGRIYIQGNVADNDGTVIHVHLPAADEVTAVVDAVNCKD